MNLAGNILVPKLRQFYEPSEQVSRQTRVDFSEDGPKTLNFEFGMMSSATILDFHENCHFLKVQSTGNLF